MLSILKDVRTFVEYTLPKTVSESLDYPLNWNEGTAENTLFNQYPAGEYENLIREVVHSKLFKGEFLVFDGSDDALQFVISHVKSQSTKLITTMPTYNQFLQVAQFYGLQSVTTPYEMGLLGIEESLRSHPESVVYLGHPNNPTGFLGNSKEILELISKYSSSLFIIDEAYIEFKGDSLLNHGILKDNILITRTMSKFYNLAGLRVGFLVLSSNMYNYFRINYNRKKIDIAKREKLENFLIDLNTTDLQASWNSIITDCLNLFTTNGISVEKVDANFISLVPKSEDEEQRILKIAKILKYNFRCYKYYEKTIYRFTLQKSNFL
jgi:histidinol-phosphate/aromatic aminotransferase/cobyric acid decarboxylase-like protein